MARYITDKARLILYAFLVARDGELCFHCRKPPKEGHRLEFDHTNGDRTDNSPENVHLLCKKCNLDFRIYTEAEHRAILKRDSSLCVGVCVSGKREGYKQANKIDYGYQYGSAQIQANLTYESLFREWLIRILNKHGSVTRKEAIAGGCAFAGCSSKTAERYLIPLSSIYEGILEEYRENGFTMLRFKPIKGLDANNEVEAKKVEVKL